MYNKIYNLAPWRLLMKRRGLTETSTSKKARISRLTLRSVLAGKTSVELNSLVAAAEALDCRLTVTLTSGEINSECSTACTGIFVLRDGFSSWKVHYMNLVDEFRRTLDPRLFLLPPSYDLPIELRALLAAITWALCNEAGMEAPCWAKKQYALLQPWFVSETESLKATAILESPLPFRRNNIFVLGNFLDRG